jgi:hypothetical protein
MKPMFVCLLTVGSLLSLVVPAHADGIDIELGLFGINLTSQNPDIYREHHEFREVKERCEHRLTEEFYRDHRGYAPRERELWHINERCRNIAREHTEAR